MKVKIELSRVQENREKRQLRFSFQFFINDIPIMLITGMRIKNNKLLFPSYLNGGQHKALVFLYPPLLDKLKEMLENDIGYYYTDYAATVETDHCAPKTSDITTLLGEKTLIKEFEL